jgi:hypothetical protein
MQGHLEKKGALGRWANSWCVFTPESRHLGVYANRKSKKAKVKIIITALFDVPERQGKKIRSNRFDLEASTGTLHAFSAGSAADKKAWVDAVTASLAASGRGSIQKHPRFVKGNFTKKREGTLAQERFWLGECVEAMIDELSDLTLNDQRASKIDQKSFVDPDHVMLKEALNGSEIRMLVEHGDKNLLLGILNDENRTEPTAAARLVNDCILEKWPDGKVYMRSDSNAIEAANKWCRVTHLQKLVEDLQELEMERLQV